MCIFTKIQAIDLQEAKLQLNMFITKESKIKLHQTLNENITSKLIYKKLWRYEID
jgi:hypothetical protein